MSPVLGPEAREGGCPDRRATFRTSKKPISGVQSSSMLAATGRRRSDIRRRDSFQGSLRVLVSLSRDGPVAQHGDQYEILRLSGGHESGHPFVLAALVGNAR